MEQNMLPLLWQPLSTVALIRAVMEMVRREEYRDAGGGPEVESASGRAEGFSRAHRMCDGKLSGQGSVRRYSMIKYESSIGDVLVTCCYAAE